MNRGDSSLRRHHRRLEGRRTWSCPLIRGSAPLRTDGGQVQLSGSRNVDDGRGTAVHSARQQEAAASFSCCLIRRFDSHNSDVTGSRWRLLLVAQTPTVTKSLTFDLHPTLTCTSQTADLPAGGPELATFNPRLSAAYWEGWGGGVPAEEIKNCFQMFSQPLRTSIITTTHPEKTLTPTHIYTPPPLSPPPPANSRPLRSMNIY